MPRAAVPGHDAHALAGVLEQLHDDLASVGEPHDVARDLRDRRRDEGQLRPREPDSRSQLPRRLTRRDDVPVRPDGDADLVVTCGAAFHQRLAEPCTDVALEEMAGGVDLSLPPAVTARQRKQDGTAPCGGWLDAVPGQQVLDTQPGAGPVELGGE